MKNWKPIITLLLLSSFLTELLTTNAPISVFFNPGFFLFFITVGYGFPILIIREITVRKNFGLLGMFFLGIIYGLYNEALIAKTIFYPFYSPFDTFSLYGLVENIRIPWMLVISFWHALYAIIYPIIFVYYLFPAHAQEPWISKKNTWILSSVVFIFGLTVFFIEPFSNLINQLNYFIFIIIIWVFLWWLSNKLSDTPKISQKKDVFDWKSPGIGVVLFFVFFLAPLIFSQLNLEPVIFIFYFMLAMIIGMLKLTKIKEVSLNKMVLIALGAEISMTLFTIFTSLSLMKIEQIISGFIFIAIFVLTIFKLKKKFKSASSAV